jgi:hypothetical protein
MDATNVQHALANQGNDAETTTPAPTTVLQLCADSNDRANSDFN